MLAQWHQWKNMSERRPPLRSGLETQLLRPLNNATASGARKNVRSEPLQRRRSYSWKTPPFSPNGFTNLFPTVVGTLGFDKTMTSF